MVKSEIQKTKADADEFFIETESTNINDVKNEKPALVIFKNVGQPLTEQRNLADVFARLKKSTRKKSAGIF